MAWCGGTGDKVLVRGQNLKSQLPRLVSVLMNFRECREFSLLASGGMCRGLEESWGQQCPVLESQAGVFSCTNARQALEAVRITLLRWVVLES